MKSRFRKLMKFIRPNVQVRFVQSIIVLRAVYKTHFKILNVGMVLKHFSNVFPIFRLNVLRNLHITSVILNEKQRYSLHSLMEISY